MQAFVGGGAYGPCRWDRRTGSLRRHPTLLVVGMVGGGGRGGLGLRGGVLSGDQKANVVACQEAGVFKV